jgi:hypothetical protein
MNNEQFDANIKNKLLQDLPYSPSKMEVEQIMSKVRPNLPWYSRSISFKLPTLLIAAAITAAGVSYLFSNRNEKLVSQIELANQTIIENHSIPAFISDEREQKITDTKNYLSKENEQSKETENYKLEENVIVHPTSKTIKANLSKNKILPNAIANKVSTSQKNETNNAFGYLLSDKTDAIPANTSKKQSLEKLDEPNLTNNENLAPKHTDETALTTKDTDTKISLKDKEISENHDFTIINILERQPLQYLKIAKGLPVESLHIIDKKSNASKYSSGVLFGGGSNMVESGLLIKYNINNHFSIGSGLKVRAEFEREYANETTFQNARGVKFRKIYKADFNNKENINSIKLQQQIFEIPVVFEYKNNYFKYFNIVTGLSASYIAVDKHQIEFSSGNARDERFTNNVQDAKIGNIQWNLGLEKSFGRYNFQILPTLILSKVEQEYRRHNLQNGSLQVRAFYQF